MRAGALLIVAALLAGLAAAGEARAQGAAPVLAIEGGTVHVEPGVVLEGATVLVRDGRIDQVGVGVAIPAGARRIAAEGKVVTAGLVDASSRLGLVEVDAVPSTNEGRFERVERSIHAAFRVTDGYNPRAAAIPVARTGGVTSAVAAPSGGLIAGTSAWFALAGGLATSRVTVKSPLAMYVNLGEGALQSGDGSRGKAVARLRELFDDAEQYARNRQRFERNQTREFAAGRLDLEALGPVLSGAVPLVVRVHRASDITAALGLVAERPRLRLIIEGGGEAWQVAAELAAARVPVILDPAANLPSSFDRLHVRDDAAAVLTAAGVEVAISTLGGSSNVRNLRQLAGIAVASGMDPAAALAAVTTVPARIFGVGDRGAIRRGAAADLVVWSGDPFELSTRVERVLIGGVEQSLQNRQSRLLERYR